MKLHLYKLLAKYLLGIAIVVFIVAQCDIKRISQNLAAVKLSYLGIIVAWWLIIRAYKALIWRLYLQSAGIGLTFLKSLWPVMGASLINNLVPSQLGGFSRMMYVKGAGSEYSFVNLSSTIIVEQLLTAGSYCLILLFGACVLTLRQVEMKIAILLWAIFLLYTIVLAIFILCLSRNVVSGSGLLGRFAARISGKLAKYGTNFRETIASILSRPATIVKGLVLQVLMNTVLTGVMFYFLFKGLAMDCELGFLFILVVSLACSFSIVPFSPNGIGIVEWVAILLFEAILAYQPSDIISVFLLYRIINVIMSLAAGGACHFLSHGIFVSNSSRTQQVRAY